MSNGKELKYFVEQQFWVRPWQRVGGVTGQWCAFLPNSKFRDISGPWRCHGGCVYTTGIGRHCMSGLMWRQPLTTPMGKHQSTQWDQVCEVGTCSPWMRFRLCQHRGGSQNRRLDSASIWDSALLRSLPHFLHLADTQQEADGILVRSQKGADEESL